MSISSAILALSPTVYWPMGETVGSTAHDQSGGGHDGLFRSGVVLGAPGPETGTFAAACSDTHPNGPGVLLSSGNPCTGLGPFSFGMWSLAATYANAPGNKQFVGVGGTRGIGNYLDAGVVKVQAGPGGTGSMGVSVVAGRWCHLHYDFTRGGTQNAYLDGVLASSSAATGATAAVLGTDPLLAYATDVGLIAHAAFWNRVLSAAEVATITSGRVNPQEIIPPIGRALTDLDLTPLTDLLGLIYAAVHKTY